VVKVSRIAPERRSGAREFVSLVFRGSLKSKIKPERTFYGPQTCKESAVPLTIYLTRLKLLRTFGIYGVTWETLPWVTMSQNGVTDRNFPNADRFSKFF